MPVACKLLGKCSKLRLANNNQQPYRKFFRNLKVNWKFKIFKFKYFQLKNNHILIGGRGNKMSQITFNLWLVKSLEQPHQLWRALQVLLGPVASVWSLHLGSELVTGGSRLLSGSNRDTSSVPLSAGYGSLQPAPAVIRETWNLPLPLIFYSQWWFKIP